MNSHDLPLTSLCRTIELNLLQTIDAEEIPEILFSEKKVLTNDRIQGTP